MRTVRLSFLAPYLQEYQCHTILDAGFGEGSLSIPLKNLGYDVVCWDKGMPLPSELFDACILSEVLEHSGLELLEKVLPLVRQGGYLFITTPNKTWASYLTHIVIAQDILKMIPKETHQFESFIPKDLMIQKLHEKGFEVLDQIGINPFSLTLMEPIVFHYMLFLKRVSF